MHQKVIIIYPTPITEAYIHLGIIGQMLKNKGFEVEILENTFKRIYTPIEMATYAKMKGYTLALIPMMTIDVLMIYELFRRLKKEKIEVLTAGPHPTDCPEECIENGADIVVRNELEGTLSELCDYWKGKKELKDISGITYRDKNGIKFTDRL